MSGGENNLFSEPSPEMDSAREGARRQLSAAQSVLIYTDGACSGNPGPGGWGAVICDLSGGDEADLRGSLRLSGGEANTTNNRMELLAAIEALAVLPQGCEVRLYTDSTYVQKGISEWIDRWRRKNWRTAAGKPVSNQDLWRQLDAQAAQHNVQWHWVEGHSGDPGNELADELARSALKRD